MCVLYLYRIDRRINYVLDLYNVYMVAEAFVVNNNHGCILYAYIICLCIGIRNRLNINNNPIKVTN